ncbi:exonuclease VII small subunit [uncultured Desulfobacterium sp.]|uniref:Exodeoxyribonuclease 7 small subunit n=1 Tax=uncultured Desulfobacterium sp. TaxID=201089 RepID=A0A445N257_9BACT|nr:exonuclease VII small subunit [uncultured Desulfobacterium sp.]
MAEKKFEEAMKRLEEIVRDLERGDLSLEDSLKYFEEGMKLIKFSTHKLEEAEKKVAMLIGDAGKYRQVPFEPEEGQDGDDIV